MIDRFTKRLEAQKGNRAYIQPKIYLIEEDEEKQVIDSNEPLSPSELKFYLEKMENEENKNTQIVPNSIAFDSINSFCAWYEPRRDKFLEKQRPAFESLVHTKGLINLGCACKIHVRQKMADDYYENFFSKNQHTDLIPKIKEIAEASTVIFKVGDREFLRV